MERRPFPYPYGTDLYWLWGWGYRLGSLLTDHEHRSECDWMIFRPDESADDAMMRFSIDYPAVIAELRVKLAEANNAFDEFLRDRTPSAESVFSDWLGILESRIVLAAKLIAEREGIEPNPASVPKSNIRSRQHGELDSIIAPQVATRRKSRADKKTDNEKKLPPNEVNDCARYIRDQWKLIEEGKRPTATKKALIAEHLGSNDTGAMEKNLRPSRYGWILEAGRTADK